MDVEFVLTDDGADEVVRRAANLVTGDLFSYFKLGEGGFNLSDLVTETNKVTGDGSKNYEFTVDKLPVGRNTFEVTDGTQVVTDDGSGNLTGDGSGTINYKTGEVSVDFDSNVGSGAGISPSYKYHGVFSEEKTKVIATSPSGGAKGIFFGIIDKLPIAEATLSIDDGQDTPQVVTDDGSGNLTGDGSGTVDYENGEIRVIFSSDVPEGNEITATYKYDGAPKEPVSTYSDLESESDPNLYTFTKSFGVDSKTTVTNLGNGKVLCKVHLDLWEALDDGEGNPPYFFEGGLFSENDVLVGYFTFSKMKKEGSRESDIYAYGVF